jgi:predicted amidohydrolase
MEVMVDPFKIAGAQITSVKGDVTQNIDTHHKIHLQADEKAFFAAGREHAIVEIAGKKVGISICADTNDPSHAAARELGN